MLLGGGIHYNNPDAIDYESISGYSSASDISNITDLYPLTSSYPSLYNGNISYMVTAINEDDGNSNLDPVTQLTAYTYDQLNRLSSMGTYLNFNQGANQWNAGSISTKNIYNTNYSYDANGNIHSLQRNNRAEKQMDDLLYTYDWIDAGDPSKGKHSNKLLSVSDSRGVVNGDDFGEGSSYTYDNIGNLIKDSGEEIFKIEWTVSGKVKRVTRDQGSSKPDLEFNYDAMGNRIMKKVIESTGATTITYYIRDAPGNVLTTYKEDDNNDVFLQDFAIYGSSRLGMQNINKNVLSLPNLIDNTTPVQTKIGDKYYELSNHLGNVLTTVSDRKLEVEDGSSGTIAYYTADIISSSDYYPFGFQMDRRDYSSDSYRYGFNGKEKDDEFTNSTSHYDFGARIYDSRVGRWLAVDPKAGKYPGFSPYNYVFNSPLLFIDPQGEDIELITIKCIEGCSPYAEVDEIREYTEGLTSNNTIRAMQAFMATDEGYNAVAQYAKAGDVITIGSIEYKFDKDGEFSDQILRLTDFVGYDDVGVHAQTSDFVKENKYTQPYVGERKVSVNEPINKSHLTEDEATTIGKSISFYFDDNSVNVIADAISIAHEFFIHDSEKSAVAFKNKDYNSAVESLNNSNKGDHGKSDHDNYTKNGNSKMNNFFNELKDIFNDSSVDKMQNEHDKKYR